MADTELVLYREEDGTVPVVEWLRELQRTNRRAFEKCLFLIGLLEQFGRELRRPRADFLRNGVYELRTQVSGVNYRLLYGFVGKDIALVAHGLTKSAKVPDRDIDLAAARLERFKRNPLKHAADKESIPGEEQEGNERD